MIGATEVLFWQCVWKLSQHPCVVLCCADVPNYLEYGDLLHSQDFALSQDGHFKWKFKAQVQGLLRYVPSPLLYLLEFLKIVLCTQTQQKTGQKPEV